MSENWLDSKSGIVKLQRHGSNTEARTVTSCACGTASRGAKLLVAGASRLINMHDRRALPIIPSSPQQDPEAGVRQPLRGLGSGHECRIMHNQDLRRGRRGRPALLRSCLQSSHGIRLYVGTIVFPLSISWSATCYPCHRI